MNPQLQNQYRQYTQTQARAQATSRRTGNIPPNAQATAHHQQLFNQQMQQRNAAMEHQLAQRRARKPTDKTMPDGIEDLVVDDSVRQYKELREVERNLDYTMMRKRHDLQDTFSRGATRQKTIRIWISNSVANQPWQNSASDAAAFDFSSGSEPTYTVKIEGRIPEESHENLFEEDEEETEEQPTSQVSKKMTHFFKRVTIDFDKARSMNTDLPPTTIEWTKPKDFADVDALQFQRKGDENMNITINLYRDETPEVFRLSQALSQTLDIEEANRAEVVQGLLDYSVAQGLQDDEDKRLIRCDDRLYKIFGQHHVNFTSVPDLIIPHLHPSPSITIPFTIRFDQEYHSNPTPTIYDVCVTEPDLVRNKVIAFTQNQEYHNDLRQIAQLDDQLAVIIQGIQHRKARHTFFTSMSKDPARFVEKWTESQRRDLQVILGEAGRGGEDGLGSEFAVGGPGSIWSKDVTYEAVRNTLARPGVTSKT